MQGEGSKAAIRLYLTLGSLSRHAVGRHIKTSSNNTALWLPATTIAVCYEAILTIAAMNQWLRAIRDRPIRAVYLPGD